jgi:hypothetical protein
MKSVPGPIFRNKKWHLRSPSKKPAPAESSHFVGLGRTLRGPHPKRDGPGRPPEIGEDGQRQHEGSTGFEDSPPFQFFSHLYVSPSRAYLPLSRLCSSISISVYVHRKKRFVFALLNGQWKKVAVDSGRWQQTAVDSEDRDSMIAANCARALAPRIAPHVPNLSLPIPAYLGGRALVGDHDVRGLQDRCASPEILSPKIN